MTLTALRSAPKPIARPGGSVVPFRHRKTDRRSETSDDLRMEVRAAGQEMKATATFITNALLGSREPDIRSAVHAAGRLWTLGNSYADPDNGGTAA